jgi:hypothetical protein
MWSWHWSPLTQTSLLFSPSDGLASFLKTNLANGVKVVENVILSKFRFHLIAIYALECFRYLSCTPVSLKCSRVRIEMNYMYEKFKRSDRPDRFRSLKLLSTIFSPLLGIYIESKHAIWVETCNLRFTWDCMNIDTNKLK